MNKLCTSNFMCNTPYKNKINTFIGLSEHLSDSFSHYCKTKHYFEESFLAYFTKQTNLLCQSKTKGQKFPPFVFLLNQQGVIERYWEMCCSSSFVTDSHLPGSLCELFRVLKELIVCSGLNQQTNLKLSPALTWFVFLRCWSGVFMASGSLATAFIGSIKAFSS